MGFYIRKSVRVGPLRFNLSKSGIGVSAGIRGFRVGTGPRGNYVHIGAGGLYYRQTLPAQGKFGAEGAKSDVTSQPEIPPSTHGPMQPIASECVTQMVDSTSAVLLSEIQRKRNRILLWPFATACLCVAAVLLFGASITWWVTLPVLLIAATGVAAAYQWDVLKKGVVVMYDLDEQSTAAFQTVYDALTALGHCGATWHVNARGEVYDPKYHAGAGHLVSRKRIHVAEHQPPFLRSNVTVIRVPLTSSSLFFFPDRVLVYTSRAVGAVNYADLRLSLDTNRFIEDGYVPGDAHVVDRTWQFVNKKGGPDRRFKSNRELPVCLYEELRLHSNSGLNELLQVSRVGVGRLLSEAFATMASSLASAESVRESKTDTSPSLVSSRTDLRSPQPVTESLREPTTERAQDKLPSRVPTWTSRDFWPPQPPTMEELYGTLFDVLCCVMVADGRASRIEKSRIVELMRDAKAPWTNESIDTRITEFIEKVRQAGFSNVLSETMSRLPVFKQTGREETLLRSIELVANADGDITANEQALFKRIREAVR